MKARSQSINANSRGFTLIEVMVSLLIFAVCGTISFSVFTLNESQRANLNERSEARLIAHNFMSTLLLKNKTDSALTESGAAWNDGGGQPVFPGLDKWQWESVPAQTWTQVGGNPPTADKLKHSSNVPNLYEVGYCLKGSLGANYTQVERTQLNNNNMSDSFNYSGSVKLLTVVVTWPESKPRWERNRITTNTYLS